jgi:hypothetical protein
MTVLEQAARALPQLLGPHSFDELPLDRAEQRALNRIGDRYEHTQADMLDLARAVLQAIREPSDLMRTSGQWAISDCLAVSVCVENNFKAAEVWQAMIDRALSE